MLIWVMENQLSSGPDCASERIEIYSGKKNKQTDGCIFFFTILINFKEMEKLTQGCHASGKSQENMNFKVRELSGNFATCQGNLKILVNVR